MSATLRTLTLGCKVNQYETEYVREGLLGIGFRDAEGPERADLCIVNTCTVTHEGDAKSRQAIRRLARENPDARIVVMGCYATRAPEEVAALPGVSEVVTDKRELPDLLGRFGVVDIPTGISGFTSRRRAYVKVQDGCLLQCSYCIIPTVRPHLTSRPLEHIVAEVERLVANGHREVVLTGIHLGHYGIEGNWGKPKSAWIRLADLVRRLALLPGDFRIRLSSIEATEVTRELIAVMAEFPDKICPHLHICLQSGSDNVLRRMRRRWSARSFVDRCQLVQKTLDLPALTTDIIVGFPGETEDDFAATVRVVQEVGFMRLHVFSFSARKGTPAAGMPDQVPAPLCRERYERLLKIGHELHGQYLRRLIGRELTVMLEGPGKLSPNQWVGTACRYASVEAPAVPEERGQLVRVLATMAIDDRLLGVRIRR
jgi:threonylcarbamoyladenosine tRNA methylthiotransferase MtaB